MRVSNVYHMASTLAIAKVGLSKEDHSHSQRIMRTIANNILIFQGIEYANYAS